MVTPESPGPPDAPSTTRTSPPTSVSRVVHEGLGRDGERPQTGVVGVRTQRRTSRVGSWRVARTFRERESTGKRRTQGPSTVAGAGAKRS